MARGFGLLGLSFSLLAALPGALGANIQIPGLQVPPSARAHRDAVEKIFTTSYDAYKQFALGHDDLSPISKSFSDPLGGWGASLVDAMDTMLVMGLNDLFNEAVNFSAGVNFSHSNTPDDVSVFETTIRYVGGYMSAYELSGFRHPILVQKAKEVADKLFVGFVGDNPIPYNEVNFTSNQPAIDTTNVAQAGTLTLEYNRLSKYTGDKTYETKAVNAVKHLTGLVDPLPGLPAQGVDPGNGSFVGAYVTWGGGTDSYLEYLSKYARLTNTNDPEFMNTWALAVDSSIKTLMKTSTVGDYTYLADWDNGTIIHLGSHLECFHAGNWIMGGKMLNNQTIVDIGLKLNEACWNTYASTATGIGPEVFYFISSDGNFTGDSPPTPAQLAFYAQHGFYIAAADYVQRPEVLESNFYAWRSTGDTKYLDRAASAVNSFNTFLRAPAGYMGLNDVNNKTSSGIDDQESFWFAEVLKYLYLTFDDPNHISLDKFVFNTECHPYIAPPAKPSYGTPPYPTQHPPFRVIPGNLPGPSPDPAMPRQLKDILHLP